MSEQPKQETLLPVIGSLALAVAWGAYTIYFLGHFIFDVMN